MADIDKQYLDPLQSPFLLRAVIDSSPIAMVMVDEEGHIVLVNKEIEQLFGYERQELLGNAIEMLVPERYRGLHPAYRTGYFVDPQARRMGAGRDLFALRKDGSEFPVEIGLNPIQTQFGLFVLSAIVDITERKRMEARFRSTVESAPTAMVMIDRKGNIVLVNAETEKLFGYERDELLGRPVELLVPDRFRPQHPSLRTGFFKAPQSRRMGEGRDLYGMRKNGSEFPIEIGLNPVETDQGLFVLSAIVDITQRKSMEESQRKLNLELERSNIELQQFAYIASHDLQTPLRGIAGFAQLLQHRFIGKLDEKADDVIARMVASVMRMQTLINDLLAYSRVDAKARPFAPTDMKEVFDDVVTILEPSIREASAELTCDPLPTVQGDRSQLVQLLQNLVNNSLKYHGNDVPRVHVSAQKQADEWVFSVTDNGIGIETAYHEKIFEIFGRLHTQEHYPGTGIGLAVCRRVVHRHGGRIWVQSEAGLGSTFFFTIPEKR